MAKPSFLAVFFLLAAYSFAIDFPFGNPHPRTPDARSIYIEGTAEQEEHKTFFMDHFAAEAYALGLIITDYSEDAEFTFRFYVQSHADEYDPSINYIILISLVDNEADMEMVSFGWPFAELQDMYEHAPFIFYMAAALIPGAILEDVRIVRVHDTRWQNQMLYLRLSLDYPIAFFILQPTGLFAGQAAYAPGPPGGVPDRIQHLDHIIMPRPGITVGVEWMFHDFLSAELNFQGRLGDPSTYMFFNVAVGAQLKGVFRTNTFMLQPYIAVSRALNTSPEFRRFPPFALGGGGQVSVRGGSTGAFFLDINFMHYIGNVQRRNPYARGAYPLAPNPSRIHYRHFVVGLGIGYKFGLLER